MGIDGGLYPDSPTSPFEKVADFSDHFIGLERMRIRVEEAAASPQHNMLGRDASILKHDEAWRPICYSAPMAVSSTLTSATPLASIVADSVDMSPFVCF
jgi:hypothetical protein